MPRVRPNPKPDAKDAKKKELPPAPDSVEWKDTAGVKLNKEEFDSKDLFGHFSDMGDIKETKPVLIYFYWPEEDAESTDKNIANQVRLSKLMEDNILSSEEFRRASLCFHCFKCNIKDDVDDQLKTKYRLKVAPKILFFDVRGSKVWQLTSTKADPEGVAKKMAQIAAASKSIIDNMKK